MGSIFRSEEMFLCQMFIQSEAAYSSISELGETGAVQFRNLNSDVNPFQRRFTNEIRRCDEMERMIRYIEAEMKKDNVTIPELDIDEVPRVPNIREILDLEALLEKHETEIVELSQNGANLKSTYQEMIEMHQVLEKAFGFFKDEQSANGIVKMSDEKAEESTGQLGFIAGVIQRDKFPGFERMLWRISHGNVFLRQTELMDHQEDPSDENLLDRSVFVAFYQGEQLKTRINRICFGYHASLYPCPVEQEERNEMLQDVRVRIEDMKMVMNQTKDHRQRVLAEVAKGLPIWTAMICKMKAIYHTLNMFSIDLSNNCLVGECWIPVQDIQLVQKALYDGSSAVDSTIKSFLNVIKTNDIPPTFYRTNKFTRAFQTLIDSYGVASYRECNPALYSIITFPFLFAIMFGDLGHGFIMTLFAAWMVIWEKRLSMWKAGEIWSMFFGGRYIILLMGLFSMYTGIVYNDIFSKTMNIFGSSWSINYNTSTIMRNTDLVLNPASEDYSENIYPLGLDPAWMLGKNKIIFLNTLKMKMSIIIGVIHMIFGVSISVINYNHLRKRSSILLEFLPQVLFLILLFGYMVFMMFFKWMAFGYHGAPFVKRAGCAPSILIMFINMMLFKYEDSALENCNEFMFDFQKTLQIILVVLSLLCIPVMLLGKPLYILYQRKRESVESDTSDEEPMSEVFIHQVIHTIEYVLSTISHTASYLRLWALSLAHAQLSEVLWMMTLEKSFLLQNIAGAPFLFFVFGFWAIATITILCLMEGLSAFLHTLRLHWVEFMSKFYEGLGYVFQPFSFKVILAGEAEA
ncbi:V-type proton ATPase subunit a [Sergentomyia squamirostris]